MTDEDSEPVREALDRAQEAFGPPDDPLDLDPDYPPDYTPEDRVRHVINNEYPKWRGMEWIAAAADTEMQNCESVIVEMLSEGEVEISEDGVRKNRYYLLYEKVNGLVEKAGDRPGWI